MLEIDILISATLITVLSWTGSKDGERAPVTQQTATAIQGQSDLTAHIGVAAAPALVLVVVGMAGDVDDVIQAANLLHRNEADIRGNAGCKNVDVCQAF